MKHNFVLLLIAIFFITCQSANAFILNGRGMVYAGSTANRARYYPNNIYGNRFQQPRPNYIFSPQQARYYGYRTNGYNGAGYNSTYYYNRFRR